MNLLSYYQLGCKKLYLIRKNRTALAGLSRIDFAALSAGLGCVWIDQFAVTADLTEPSASVGSFDLSDRSAYHSAS